MSDGTDATIDMIRLTFTADPDRRAEVEAHLADLGLDVHGMPDGHVVATWEEPDGDLDAVVEALWAINGAPFEITHEEFRRLNLLVFHHADDEPDQAAA